MLRPVAAQVRSVQRAGHGSPWLVVGLAAIVPYLPTLDDYFVRDDFGVVQLLAQKPWSYFPRWFASSWMDDIWGYHPDEMRPFPALSYQLTALGGAGLAVAASRAEHPHARGQRPAGDGDRAARRGPRRAAAAAFAALVFVLLPVHAESVAWITGRVDSMPALFYLASFLAYVRCRQRATRRRCMAGRIVLFFVALFTKQNTITMVATLAGYDVIVGRRPDLAAVGVRLVRTSRSRAMTAGYLWLRYVLFGEVAREGALNARALEDFRVLLGRHIRHVVAGDIDAPAVVVWLALALVVAVWLAAPCPRRPQTEPLAARRCCTSGPSGGRLACCRSRWLAITRRGTCISPPSAGRSCSASRLRPRGWRGQSRRGGARVRRSRRARRCSSTSCRSHRSVVEWSEMAAVSQHRSCATSVAPRCGAAGEP